MTRDYLKTVALYFHECAWRKTDWWWKAAPMPESATVEYARLFVGRNRTLDVRQADGGAGRARTTRVSATIPHTIQMTPARR